MSLIGTFFILAIFVALVTFMIHAIWRVNEHSHHHS